LIIGNYENVTLRRREKVNHKSESDFSRNMSISKCYKLLFFFRADRREFRGEAIEAIKKVQRWKSKVN